MSAMQSNESFFNLDTNRQKLTQLPNSPQGASSLEMVFIPQRLQISRQMQPEPNAESPNRGISQSSRYIGTDLNEQPSSQVRSEKRLRSGVFNNKSSRGGDRLANIVDKTRTMKKAFKSIQQQPDYGRNFIYLLKKASNTLRLDQLTIRQNIIVKSLIDGKLNQISSNGMKKILDYFPLFDNQSKFIHIIDIVQVFLVVLANFWYPLEISFEVNQIGFQGYLDYLLVFINSLDILISFNRSSIIQGQVIRDKLTIFHNYMESQFFKDFLSNLCVLCKGLVSNEIIQSIAIILFMFCRLPRVVRILDELNDYLNINILMRDVLSLINMILTVIFIVHFVACIWHGVSVKIGEVGWVEVYGYEGLPVFQIYQISFYWAAMTMTTVGYGDITPKNQYEYVCANLTMLVACIVFGYTMNRIGLLLSNIHMRKASFKNNIASLNLYMSKYDVDNQLQSRIRSYLDYLWEAENEYQNKQVEVLIEKLPETIKQELSYQVRGKVVESCKIFERFSSDLKKELCSIVEGTQYVPNEVVLDPQKYDGSSMYIIQQGQLQLYHGTQKITDALTFGPGKMVGEVSFFTDQPRSMKVISLGFTTCYKICRDQFLYLLNDFTKDRELFHYLKDSLNFYQQYQKIQTQCLCCQSDSHVLNMCPLLGLHQDKDKVIKRSQFPTAQGRIREIAIDRREREKHSTLLRFKDTQAFALVIQDNLKRQESVISMIDEDQYKSLTYLSKQESDSYENTLIQNDKHQEQSSGILAVENINLKKVRSRPNTILIDIPRRNNDQQGLQPIYESFNEDSQISSDQIVRQRANSELKSRVNEGSTETLRARDTMRQGSGQGASSFAKYISQQHQRVPSQVNSSQNNPKLQVKPLELQSPSILGPYEMQTQQSQSQINQQFESQMIFQSVPHQTNTVKHQISRQNLPVDEIYSDFERTQEYSNYFPNGNLSVVLKRLAESQRIGKQQFSNYTFNWAIMKKTKKLKRLLEKTLGIINRQRQPI